MNLNLRSVFRFLAFIMLFIAAIMLVPTFMAIGYGERRAFTSFAMTVGIMLLASCLTIIITRREKELRIGTKAVFRRFDGKLCPVLLRDHVRLHHDRRHGHA